MSEHVLVLSVTEDDGTVTWVKSVITDDELLSPVDEAIPRWLRPSWLGLQAKRAEPVKVKS